MIFASILLVLGVNSVSTPVRIFYFAYAYYDNIVKFFRARIISFIKNDIHNIYIYIYLFIRVITRTYILKTIFVYLFSCKQLLNDYTHHEASTHWRTRRRYSRLLLTNMFAASILAGESGFGSASSC